MCAHDAYLRFLRITRNTVTEMMATTTQTITITKALSMPDWAVPLGAFWVVGNWVGAVVSTVVACVEETVVGAVVGSSVWGCPTVIVISLIGSPPPAGCTMMQYAPL